MADDAGVLQQALDVFFHELGHPVEVETFERPPEILPLRERIVRQLSPDWEPSRQIFSKRRWSSATESPLRIVIGEEFIDRTAPGAAGFTIGSGTILLTGITLNEASILIHSHSHGSGNASDQVLNL